MDSALIFMTTQPEYYNIYKMIVLIKTAHFGKSNHDTLTNVIAYIEYINVIHPKICSGMAKLFE